MKKKIVLRLLSLSLCGVLVATGITTFVRADSGSAETENTPAVVTVAEKADESFPSSLINNESAVPDKDETVYVLTDADGSVQKIIVSDWLKNAKGEASLQDVTGLNHIENVKGDETFSTAQGETTWNAGGKDLYYVGDTDKALPVSVVVKYFLGGKEISADELKGKSGHVTIRYEYENHQYSFREIDGKQEKIYVPFTMLTGLVLDNEVFTNVEVKGGRLVNDGERTLVAGVAFPGLQENLKIDTDKFEIPDSLEIEADVRYFSIGSAMTLATNELLNTIDLDRIDSSEELQDAVGRLTDAMAQLLDGSAQLSDGLNLLLEKSGDLTEGVRQLADGATKLTDGAAQLNEGAGKLQGGISSLSSGLNTLTSNNAALNGGARQVFETFLSTAKDQLTAAGLSVPDLTIENYGTVLNQVISSLDESKVYEQALKQVTEAVYAQSDLIREKVTAAIREQVTLQVQEAVRQTVAEKVIQGATGMDASSYEGAVAAGMISEEVQTAISSAIETQMKTEEISQLISATVDAKMAEDSMKAMIESTLEDQIRQIINEKMTSPEVQEKLAAASEGAKKVIALKASLDNYNSFYSGLQSYLSGVSQAASGASQLNGGAASLKAGAQSLYDGATALNDGLQQLKASLPALTDGITQLRDGSAKLRDGLASFNEEGIQKIADAVDGDLNQLVERCKATLSVSKEYHNYSGISEGMDGQVKFIYRIAGTDND